jgi:hypothetical protein
MNDKDIVTCLGEWNAEFGSLIGFINNLQVPTTISYYTVTGLRNLQLLHAGLFCLSAVVFTGL